MGISARPYVGSWSLNNKQVYQHSPDCIVYINGDVTIPNAVNTNRQPARINFQPYITSVSVEGGTQPGSASASISLSLPVASNDSFVRDANFIFRPGLEIHVYMRGYFPARGLFTDEGEAYDAPKDAPVANATANLSKKGEQKGPKKPDGTYYTPADVVSESSRKEMLNSGYLSGEGRVPTDLTPKWDAFMKDTFGNDWSDPIKNRATISNNLESTAASMGTLQQYLEQLGYTNVSVGAAEGFNAGGHEDLSQHKLGTAIDPNVTVDGKKLDPVTVYLAASALMKEGKMKQGGLGVYLVAGTTPEGATNPANWSDKNGHFDLGGGRTWVWVGGNKELGSAVTAPYLRALAGMTETPDGKPLPASNDSVRSYTENMANTSLDGKYAGPPLTDAGFSDRIGTPALNERPANNLDDIIAYPYYHVFHGVVTQADLSYSGGMQTAALACASMLHFWQYHQLASSASYFGARPTNSKLQLSLIGHPFTGKHPYEIMYTLFHDTAGAAGGVGYTLSQKNNQNAKVGDQSLWSLNIKYWQQRFSSGRMMKLRLFGMNGQLFNSLQSTYLGRLNTAQLGQIVRARFPNSTKQDTVTVMEAKSLGIAGNQKQVKAAKTEAAKQAAANNSSLQTSQNLSGALINAEESAEGAGAFGLADMQAFVKDLGMFGQVNLFETTYQSKLDIVQEVLKITGFEFFQDVDGDFVFKPPFYNMDSSTSRVYRIEDIDLISISQSEKEPQATYSMGKGSHIKNTVGVGVDGEWGVEGRYIDYRLVAQFGWRPDSFEAMYFTNPRSLFYASVNRIDLANVESSSASVSIPLRPEIRCGYPFYIVSYDCYYYCNSFSHSWAAGGQCVTSLQLVGKRSKFFPPGDPAGRGIEKINLANTILPPVTLEVLDDSQRVKLAGFPNVVMALDPTEVNPLFFLVKDELTDLSNPLVLQAVVKIALAENLISQDPTDPDVYILPSSDKTQQRRFIVGGSDASAYTNKDNDVSVLTVAANNKENKLKGLRDQRDKDVAQKLSPLASKKAAKEQANRELAIEAGDPNTKDDRKAQIAKEIEANTKEIPQIDQAIASATNAVNSAVEQGLQDQPDEVKLLNDLLDAVGDKVLRDKKRVWGNLNNTANLLELLSDKKAMYSAHGTPGSYRYFSCSHPDPDQQGVAFEFNGSGAAVTDQSSRFEHPLSAYGFTSTQKIQRPTDPKIAVPEAELKQQTRFVQKGFWIQRPAPFELQDGRKSLPFNGTYRLLVSTAEIQTLEFGVSLLPNSISQASSQQTLSFNDFSEKMSGGVTEYLNVQVAQSATVSAELLTSTINNCLQTLQNEINAVLPVNLSALKDSVTTTVTTSKVAASPESKKAAEDAVTTATAALDAANAAATAAEKSGAVPDDLVKASTSAQKSVTQAKAKLAALSGTSTKTTSAKSKTTKSLAEAYAPNYIAGNTQPVQVYEAMASAYAKLVQASYADGANVLQKKLKGEGKKNDTIRVALTEYKDKVGLALNGLYTGTLGQSGVLFDKQPLTKDLSTSKKSATHVVHTPIFPVSDDRGYRVLGTYRYGRGIKLMPDSILDQLTTADPKSVLSPATLEQYVNAKTAPQREEAVKAAVQELSKVYAKGSLIDMGLIKKDGKISDNAYGNFMADQRDSTQQVPATNAAFSLADLGVADNVAGSTSTRGAEADVATQAFSFDFVNVIRTGDANNLKAANDLLQTLPLGPDGQPALDKASQYQAYSMVQKAPEWEQRQDDLRGTKPLQSQTSAQQAVDSVATLSRLIGGG